MPNSLYPDQARRFDEPDLGPNCLLRLSADDTDIKIYKRHANTMNATLCLFRLLVEMLLWEFLQTCWDPVPQRIIVHALK